MNKQAKLALNRLIEGNKNFVSGNLNLAHESEVELK